MSTLPHEGRLSAPEGIVRRVDLHVALYATAQGGEPLWAERHRLIRIDEQGGYRLLLGSVNPLAAEQFERRPRWLEVRADGGAAGPRVPLHGTVLLLEARVARLEAGRPGGALSARMDQLERRLTRVEATLRRLRDGYDHLHDRLHLLEAGGWRDGLLQDLHRLECQVEGPLEARLQRVEDLLIDLVGAGGEVSDLVHRVERLEAPMGDDAGAGPDPGDGGDPGAASD